MKHRSLKDFIELLDAKNELIRIKEFVNPELEITEITDRISKQKGGGKAILFENTGTQFPVLINMMGSEARINLALYSNDLDDIGNEIEELLKNFSETKGGLINKLSLLPKLYNISNWLPKSKKGKGTSQQIIHKDPDLNIFPILKCWPYDGGKFITLPLVHTVDYETNTRNVGMYRIQIFDKKLTGMHWHKHKTGARHYEQYKKAGKKMPIAIVLGGDPVYTYSATAPLPDNIDEYILAGFLRKQKVELVKCITQDIEVPADADIIIEGYVDPTEDLIYEGPFGDHTGFYSLADYYPRFHVTCITHKKDAIYPTTIVGVPPQEDAYIAKATERIFLSPIKLSMLQEIIDMNIPIVGVAHNLTIIKIKKSYPGQALKAMNTLWGAGQMMFNKTLVITDNEVDIHNYKQLAQHISKTYSPANDTHFSFGAADVLEHASSKFAFGSKICIDATTKFDEEILFDENIKNKTSKINKEKIKSGYKEISCINDQLIKENIDISIIFIKKESKKRLETISKELFDEELLTTKITIYIDEIYQKSEINTILWLTLGNIEPHRDCLIYKNENKQQSTMVIDATRKNLKRDNFKRQWPNIVTMNEDLIKQIDNKWFSYNIGDFIPSPSLKFLKIIPNKGAVVKD